MKKCTRKKKIKVSIVLLMCFVISSAVFVYGQDTNNESMYSSNINKEMQIQEVLEKTKIINKSEFISEQTIENIDGYTKCIQILDQKASDTMKMEKNLTNGLNVGVYKSIITGEPGSSLVVYNETGDIIASTTTIKATDLNGIELRSNLIEANNQIVINIDKTLRTIAYPISIEYTMTDVMSIANRGITDYFSDVRFTFPYDDGPSLSLYDRKFDCLNEYVRDVAWDTVVNKFYGTAYWLDNENGMYNQYICHCCFAVDKIPWNLEPWRPNVGYLPTVAAKCNPT